LRGVVSSSFWLLRIRGSCGRVDIPGDIYIGLRRRSAPALVNFRPRLGSIVASCNVIIVLDWISLIAGITYRWLGILLLVLGTIVIYSL